MKGFTKLLGDQPCGCFGGSGTDRNTERGAGCDKDAEDAKVFCVGSGQSRIRIEYNSGMCQVTRAWRQSEGDETVMI